MNLSVATRWVILAVSVLCSLTAASAVTYFVDFDGGNDLNPGIEEVAPWKRCPGDPEATGVPASAVLKGGDEVRFKGGVVYRGQINADFQGTETAVIAYRGDLWGDKPAILSGAVETPMQWMPCDSANEVRGNTKFAHIWHASIPAGCDTIFRQVAINGEILNFEQSTSPVDRLFIDDLKSYHVIPKGSTTKAISGIACTDPDVLRAADPNFYRDCYISLWVQGNLVKQFPILDFIPSENKIAYDTAGALPYSDRDTFYSILNNPGTIDEPGEFAVEWSSGRLFLWPPNGADLNTAKFETVRYDNAFRSVKGRCFLIQGFDIRDYFGNYKVLRSGAAVSIRGFNGVHANITVKNNSISNCRSMDGYGVIHWLDGDGLNIIDNHIHGCMRSSGIRVSGSNVHVTGNRIERIGRTGIYFGGVQSGTISGNTVHNVRGVHGNAITAYEGCSQIFILGNTVYNSPNLLTLKDGAGFYIANNIFDAFGEDASLQDWGGVSGELYFVHNACLNNAKHSMMSLNDGPWKVYNNIMDGGASSILDRGFNIYTALSWSQQERYGWSFLEGEFVSPAGTAVIVRSADGTYMLPNTSPAIDAGKTLDLEWLKTDFLGKPRQFGKSVDIGPLEKEKGPDAPTGIRVRSASPQ